MDVVKTRGVAACFGSRASVLYLGEFSDIQLFNIKGSKFKGALSAHWLGIVKISKIIHHLLFEFKYVHQEMYIVQFRNINIFRLFVKKRPIDVNYCT